MLARFSSWKRPYTRLGLSAIMAVFMLAGCAHQNMLPGGPGTVTAVPEPPSDPEARLQFHILAGELAVQRGLARQAAEHYFKAMQVSDDPAVAERATRMALLANDMTSARQAAMRWAQLDTHSLRARKVAARLALTDGDVAAATANARAVIRLDPDGKEAAFKSLATLFSSEKAHSGTALQVMKQLVRDDPDLAAAHYAEGVLAMHFEQYGTASASANRALALDPNLTDAYLLKAGALLEQDDTAQAARLMNEAFRRAPRDLDLRLGYARLLLKAEHESAAKKQFEAVLMRQRDNPEALYALGLLAIDGRQNEQARKYFMRLRRAGARPNSSAYYLGRIEELEGHYADALTWYEKVTSGPQALNAVLRKAFVMAKLGRLDDARDFLQEVRKNNPALARRLYQAEGQLLYGAHRYQDAIGVYDKALVDFGDDADLLYGRAMAETEAGRIEDAVADLRRIIDANGKDARALNALGYILSNHSTDYQKALGYVERAFQLTPDDAAVIDSMGWIQYRLGNSQKALSYLRSAYAKSPDAEIAAHLGEVLWVLGQRDEAQRVWQDGLKADPGNAAIREAEKRLTQ